MAGLLQYAAAGAVEAIGTSITERAKAAEAAAMLRMKREWDLADRQQEREWQLEDRAAKGATGGGSSGGGSRRAGGASRGGASAEDVDIPGALMAAGIYTPLAPEIMAQVEAAVSAGEPVESVIARLDRPDVVTNPAGTMVSRMVGLTPEDAPPDETKLGAPVGLKTAGAQAKPADDMPGHGGTIGAIPERKPEHRLVGYGCRGASGPLYGVAEDDFPICERIISVDEDDAAQGGMPQSPGDTPAEPAADDLDEEETLAAARDAIARGADKEAVKKMLRDNGFDPAKL
jgi:hypothetical protein